MLWRTCAGHMLWTATSFTDDVFILGSPVCTCVQYVYHMFFATQHRQVLPTTYTHNISGTICCGCTVRCGQHYMLCVYVVGNKGENGQCSPQHIICCGQQLYIVDNIREHVFHNIDNCIHNIHPQHIRDHVLWTTRNMLWMYVVDNNYILWATCAPQHR